MERKEISVTLSEHFQNWIPATEFALMNYYRDLKLPWNSCFKTILAHLSPLELFKNCNNKKRIYFFHCLKFNSRPYFAWILAMWWTMMMLMMVTFLLTIYVRLHWVVVDREERDVQQVTCRHFPLPASDHIDLRWTNICQEKCFKSNASRWFNLPLFPWEHINLRWTKIYHFLDLLLFCPNYCF